MLLGLLVYMTLLLLSGKAVLAIGFIKWGIEKFCMFEECLVTSIQIRYPSDSVILSWCCLFRNQFKAHFQSFNVAYDASAELNIRNILRLPDFYVILCPIPRRDCTVENRSLRPCRMSLAQNNPNP
jgi:hypothetical protein